MRNALFFSVHVFGFALIGNLFYWIWVITP